MVNALSVKAVFKSSLHPVAPLFMGSWNTKSSSKWRGIASELTYNSYLRNGWVTIDTGVKGSAGTPLIEFSCWEFGESRYSISLPNIMSFKFFLQKGVWGSRFITRTSVVAQEAWFDEFSSYMNSVNTYAVGSTLRKSDKLAAFFFSIAYLQHRFMLLTGSFTELSSLFLSKSTGVGSELFLYRRSIMYSWRAALYKRNRQFFAISDRRSGGLVLEYTNAITFLWFNNFFVRALTKKLLNHKLLARQTKFSLQYEYSIFGNNLSKNLTSFFEVLHRLNAFVLYTLEARAYSTINLFFSRVLRGILIDFFSIFGVSNHGRTFFSSNGASSDVNFSLVWVEMLVKRITIFLGVACLTPFNTLKLVLNFLVEAVEKFNRFSVLRVTNLAAVNITQFFSYKLTSYRVASLFSSDSFFKNTALSATTELSFDSFLTSYTRVKKRKRVKAILGLKIRRKYKPWLRYKRRRVKRALLYSYPLKVFWKPWRNSWRKLVSYLKFSAERKQFMFLYFWSINFFNFWVSKVTFGSFFFGAIRLMFFFRNFFKFYNFYVNLLKIVTVVSSRNLSRDGNLFLNLKVYLFALHVKFSRTLISFYSLCNKLFQRRWAAVSNRSAFMAINAIRRLSSVVLSNSVSTSLTATSGTNLHGSLVYLTRAYVWASRSLSFGSETGYSRAYLQFLIELRNKSLKTWLHYLQASTHAEFFKIKGSTVSNTLIFFANFKGFLSQLVQTISTILLKKPIRSVNSVVSIRKKIASVLSGFLYGAKTSLFLDSSVGQALIQKFVAVVVNLMYLRKTVNFYYARKFKKIISFMLLFAGFREDLSAARLMKKYLLTFFYWVKKLVFCVNRKHFAYSKAFLKHSLDSNRLRTNSRKLTESEFFSSVLKRINRVRKTHFRKSNLSDFNSFKISRTLVKSLIGRASLKCLRSVTRVLYMKRRLIAAKNSFAQFSNANCSVEGVKFYFNFLNLRAVSRFSTLTGGALSTLSDSAIEFFSVLCTTRMRFRGLFGFGRIVTASGFLVRVTPYRLFSPMSSFSSRIERNVLNFCLSKFVFFGPQYSFLESKIEKGVVAGSNTGVCDVLVGKNFLTFIEIVFAKRFNYSTIAAAGSDLFRTIGWLGLRVDFLSVLMKKSIGTLTVSLQTISTLASYILSARIRFLRNLSSISRHSSWVVYKHFFFLRATTSAYATKFSAAPLVRLFSLPKVVLRFKNVLFSAVQIFVRSVSEKVLVSSAKAVNCGWVAPISMGRAALGGCGVSLRAFAHIYYLRCFLAWFNFLELTLRNSHGVSKVGINLLRRGLRRSNVKPTYTVNRFYNGNLRRLRKAAEVTFLQTQFSLSLLKVFAVRMYAAQLKASAHLYLRFFARSVTPLIKRAVRRLKSILNWKKLKEVGSLALSSSVNRVCRLNYFIKLSTYLLNSHSVNSIVFGGIFYRWFAPVCVQFWNNVRAVRKLKLLPNARKVGLFPRLRRAATFRPKSQGGFKKTFEFSRKPVRRKDMKIFYYDGWQKVSNANFKNKLMPSMFSRENFLSMQLAYETVKPKFRFINLKSLRVVKRAKRRLVKFVVRSKIGLLRKRRRFKFFRRFFRRLFRRKRMNFFKKRPFYRRRIRIKLRRIIQKFFVKALLKLTFIGRRQLFLGGTEYLANVSGFLNFSLAPSYNAQVLYGYVISRYFSILYSKLVGWRTTNRLEFFKNSKLRFLFILIKSFFNKTFIHLTNFVYFFNFNSLLVLPLLPVFNQFGLEFIRGVSVKSAGAFNSILSENILRSSCISLKRVALGTVSSGALFLTNNTFWGVSRLFLATNQIFFKKLAFLPFVNCKAISAQFFSWRKPLYNLRNNTRSYLLVLDRRVAIPDFIRLNRMADVESKTKLKFGELVALFNNGGGYTGRIPHILMAGKHKYSKFLKFQGISDEGYGYLLRKFFLFNLAKYREEQKVFVLERGAISGFKFRKFGWNKRK